jgi:predicted nucleic acid-binding protein
MPDENSVAAIKALSLAAEGAVIVPSHFWLELLNVFLVSERRGRVTQEGASTGLALVSGVRPSIDDYGDHAVILELARRYSLTSYDSAYLELALRRGTPLATLDRKLAKAARSEKLQVISDLA